MLKVEGAYFATTSGLIDVDSSSSVGLGNNTKSSSGSSLTKSADSNLSTLSTITQRLTNFNFFTGEKKSSSSSTSSSTSATTVFDSSQQNNHYTHQNHPGDGGRHNSNSNSSSNHQSWFMTASNVSGCNSIDGNGIGIGGTLKLGSKLSTLQSPTGAIVTSYDPMKLIGTQSCPRFDECPLLEPLVCKIFILLIFREDCFLTACQDGFIYTWARPAEKQRFV